MNGLMMKKNRRKETRYYFNSGEQITWRRGSHRARRRRGWFNEASNSGVSFYVEACRQPQAGEELKVYDSEGAAATLCRVVRVVPLGDELALVGCRKDEAGGVEAGGQTLPRLHTSTTSSTGRRRKARSVV